MDRDAEALVFNQDPGELAERKAELGSKGSRELAGGGRDLNRLARLDTNLGAVNPARAQAQRREQAVDFVDRSSADERQCALEFTRGPIKGFHEFLGHRDGIRPRSKVKQRAANIKEKSGVLAPTTRRASSTPMDARRWTPGIANSDIMPGSTHSTRPRAIKFRG